MFTLSEQKEVCTVLSLMLRDMTLTGCSAARGGRWLVDSTTTTCGGWRRRNERNQIHATHAGTSTQSQTRQGGGGQARVNAVVVVTLRCSTTTIPP